MDWAGRPLVLSRRTTTTAAVAAVVVFVAGGLFGARSYGVNYVLYRGFAPPHDPVWVKIHGSQQQFKLASPALGGSKQDVYVYLPPGYASSARRYPVIYLLHGFPGRPLAFLRTVRMGVVEDVLVARGRAQPAILVMPFGSSGTFTDKEWVDGVKPSQGWGTFVARDLVHAIDARYRTIATRGGRAIAGLSEGGFGAIDIALRHPREFAVVESWSGYQRPDLLRSIYGPKLQLVGANDPFLLLNRAAPTLRRLHTYFWFYTGADDRLRFQNRTFAAALTSAGLRHRYVESFGGHNWALWRKLAPHAYLAAATRLSHA
jgi:enterochelin esterase-like enzyme